MNTAITCTVFNNVSQAVILVEAYPEPCQTYEMEIFERENYKRDSLNIFVASLTISLGGFYFVLFDCFQNNRSIEPNFPSLVFIASSNQLLWKKIDHGNLKKRRISSSDSRIHNIVGESAFAG